MKCWIIALTAVLLAGCAGRGGADAAAKANAELLRELRDEQDQRRATSEPLAEEPAPTLDSRVREGDALRDSGELARALWSYLQASRLAPSDPVPLLRIATLHLSAEPARSEQIFRELVRQHPKSADAYTGLGIAQLAQGKRGGAEDMLRLAIKLDPRHAPALNALGVTLDQAGNHAEARRLLNRAWEVQPRSHVPLNNLGSSYLVTGELSAAVSALERAQQLEPRDAAVMNNLGLALARLGREEEALVKFRAAGSEQASFNNMGYAAFLNRDYERALAWYERALLASGPLLPEIRRNVVALEAERLREGGVGVRTDQPR